MNIATGVKLLAAGFTLGLVGVAIYKRYFEEKDLEVDNPEILDKSIRKLVSMISKHSEKFDDVDKAILEVHLARMKEEALITRDEAKAIRAWWMMLEKKYKIDPMDYDKE